MSKFWLFLPACLLAALTANAMITMYAPWGGGDTSCMPFKYKNPQQFQVLDARSQSTIANPNVRGAFQLDDSYKNVPLLVQASAGACSQVCWSLTCMHYCEGSVIGQGTGKDGGNITVRCNG